MTLIFSPRNIASIRSCKSNFLGQLDEQFERLIRDAILRVIEIKAHSLRRQALAALGIIRKELSQM